ncbi:MAG: 50S ribosomal protein L3 [Chloroherpetonaceae bacterium]|nr:50S ribosomal protein L3 [Chthonomonadaceae bacterium]MDW8207940.1 50S ribosomal protein L3 [Chloroherpetonaceae bacterium]
MAVDTILGRKIGMTQVFDDRGEIVPVTVIEAGPCIVTQLKSVATDGYNAIQVGFGEIRPRLVNKPEAGHFRKAGVPPMRYLREIRTDDVAEYHPGDTIRCDIFQPGMRVKVTGISKGKGFAGVVKRHHFHGADMTHGSMIHRKPQSSGATDAARTFKGTKKPGQMGNKRVTVRGLRVVRVDPERNLLLVQGAVPGSDGGLLTIQRIPR